MDGEVIDIVEKIEEKEKPLYIIYRYIYCNVFVLLLLLSNHLGTAYHERKYGETRISKYMSNFFCVCHCLVKRCRIFHEIP